MLRKLWSLRAALLVPFVVLIVGVATLIGVLSYRAGAAAVDELAQHRADDILSRIELATDLHLQDSQLVLGTLSANFATGAIDMTSLASVEKHLWQIAGLTESIGYVFFGNPNGDFIGVERFADGRVNVRVRDASTDGIRHSYLAAKPGDRERIIFNQSGAYDPRVRPWYKLAAEKKTAVWSPVYMSEARGNLKMTRAMPLYKNGTLVGVVATDVTLTHLSDFLRGLAISAHGVAFICDEKGEMIANSTPDAPFVKTGGEEKRIAAGASPNPVIRAAAEAMMRAAASPAQHGMLRGTVASPAGDMLIAAKPFNSVGPSAGLGWTTAVAIPRADVLGGIAGTVQATLAICLAALLVALLTGYAVLAWFNRGLEKLVHAADNLSHAQWDQPLPLGHSVELEGLAVSFGTMANRLRSATDTVAQQNLALEESNRMLEARVMERSQQIAKISNLVEQTDDGFLVTDAEGNITYVNPAWERITGYMAGEALGRNPRLLKSGQHDHEFYANLWKVLTAGKAYRGVIINRRKDGTPYYAETTITPVRNAQGAVVEYVAVEKDVTEREKLRQEINYLAHFDSLTALANRPTLMARLESALHQGSRHYDTGQIVALLYMDLNRFKAINDQHGHDFGDDVLAEVGRRLRQCVRDGDTVARVGGDEFVALLPNLRTASAAQIVAGKIVAAIAAPVRVRGRDFTIGISIGVAIAPRDGEDAEALLRAADRAMYENKRSATS
jgi:diguanylate cyclase (GGDEF)-like protein/PAS domain S-box-containing protein